MATRSSQREKRIVRPTAPKEEEAKFGAANNWGREQLRLLGVTFKREQKLDLEKQVFGANQSEWSPELKARTFQLIISDNTRRN